MTVKEVQQAGASTAKLATLLGKAKQFIIDKTTWRPHIMDGSTPGGHPLAFENEVLKLIAQMLSEEQKQQVMANLADTWLPLTGGEMLGPIVAVTQNILHSYVDGQYINIDGGSSYDNGASLTLYGKSHPYKGMFQVKASDGTNIRALTGKADGSLDWNGKKIERLIDRRGYVFDNGEADVFRFESGLQIVSGTVTIPREVDGVLVTLQLPYATIGYAIGTTPFTHLADVMVSYSSLTTTNFKLHRRSRTGTIDFDMVVKFVCVGFWK